MSIYKMKHRSDSQDNNWIRTKKVGLSQNNAKWLAKTTYLDWHFLVQNSIFLYYFLIFIVYLTNTSTSEKKGTILNSTFLLKRYDIFHILVEENHSKEEVAYISNNEDTFHSDFFESILNIYNMKWTWSKILLFS